MNQAYSVIVLTQLACVIHLVWYTILYKINHVTLDLSGIKLSKASIIISITLSHPSPLIIFSVLLCGEHVGVYLDRTIYNTKAK